MSPCLQDSERPNNEKILCLVERDSEDEDLEDEDSDDEKNNMMSCGA